MISLLTEGPIVHHNELPMPAILYGVVAMGVFIALAFATFSYRDVANRHDHKVTNSKGH